MVNQCHLYRCGLELRHGARSSPVVTRDVVEPLYLAQAFVPHTKHGCCRDLVRTNQSHRMLYVAVLCICIETAMITKFLRAPRPLRQLVNLKKLTKWGRAHPAIAILAVFIMTACILGTACNRTVVVNTSPSVQPGIYIRSWETPAIGSLIDFAIPAPLQSYVQRRTGNRGDKWFIIKPVAAGPGDEVDTTHDFLTINGRVIAPIPTHDADGHELPLWREHRTLRSDEYFVYSSRIPNSLDSRYYGPICRRDIDAVRRCIFAWGG